MILTCAVDGLEALVRQEFEVPPSCGDRVCLWFPELVEERAEPGTSLSDSVALWKALEGRICTVQRVEHGAGRALVILRVLE